MAQQYYLFIELISFGRIDCLFVRSQYFILLVDINKYLMCVHTAARPRLGGRAQVPRRAAAWADRQKCADDARS
jgi:hypothetical protein